MSTISPPQGIEILGEVSPEGAEILTTEALELVARLHRTFEPRRRELLAARQARAAALDAGGTLDFLPETAHIREDRAGGSPPRPPTCRTAASRSPARSIAR